MRDDGAVDALDVVALAHHALPPGGLEVVLELDTEGPVVPEAVDAAVDLARRKDEAAPRAQSETRASIATGAVAAGVDSCSDMVLLGLDPTHCEWGARRRPEFAGHERSCDPR